MSNTRTKPAGIFVWYMNRVIAILKILSAFSFIAIVLPGDKAAMPISYILYSALTGYVSDFTGISIILLFTIPVLYLFFSGLKKKTFQPDNWFSLLSILILFIPIGLTIEAVRNQQGFLSHITYAIFITISIVTIFLLVRRLYVSPGTE
jgi:hypothetical protein